MRNRANRFAHGRVLWIVIGAIALYIAVLLVIYFAGNHLERKDEQETLGDLTNRFAAAMTLDYQGETYAYRRHQVLSILLIGVDRSDLSARSDLRSGGQADMLMLLAVDKSNKTITPIQLDRDTMTPIQIYGIFGDPAGTRVAQVCLAQAFGQTVEQNSLNTVAAASQLLCGIPIDYYFTLDMDGISILNDALGGVTVTLADDFSAQDPSMRAGATLTLQGAQAEIYVRGRMNVSDGTNASRMERQRTYLNALLPLLHQRMAQDLNFVGALFDALGEHVGTDMTRGFLVNEAYAYSKFTQNPIRTPAGEHSVGSDGFMEFHVDDNALKALVIETFFTQPTP